MTTHIVGKKKRDVLNVPLRPLQRELVDRAAKALRVSRAEVCRRGIELYADEVERERKD